MIIEPDIALILEKLYDNGNYKPVETLHGFAIWKKPIKESQGRTIGNAVTKSQHNFLVKNNFCDKELNLTKKGKIQAIDILIIKLKREKKYHEKNN